MSRILASWHWCSLVNKDDKWLLLLLTTKPPKVGDEVEGEGSQETEEEDDQEQNPEPVREQELTDNKDVQTIWYCTWPWLSHDTCHQMDDKDQWAGDHACQPDPATREQEWFDSNFRLGDDDALRNTLQQYSSNAGKTEELTIFRAITKTTDTMRRGRWYSSSLSKSDQLWFEAFRGRSLMCPSVGFLATPINSVTGKI